MIKIAPCLALVALGAVPALAQDFEAREPALDLRFDGTLYAGAVTLPLEDPTTNVNLGSGADPKELCVVQGERDFCVILEPGVPQDIAVQYAGETFVLRMRYRAPAAIFDETYRTQYRGTVRIEVPPAYELVNVAIALTPYAEERYGIVAETPYLEAVRHRYAHLREHPFVKALDEALRENPDSYHTLKMNGAAYRLQAGNRVVRSPIYNHVGWAGNTLEPYEKEIRDFARQADFTRFLADFAPLYEQQVEYLRSEVDIDRILGWLGREFPEVTPYDTTRIVFSPLVASNQSLATFDDDGFRELQPHVNFPYPNQIDRQVRADLRPFLHSLILFTELNHGFINPTSEKFAPRIGRSMAELGEWADEMAAASYSNPQRVFNEMVNWALFSVFAQDLLEPEDAQAMATIISDTMVKGRGFKRFDEFQREFLALRDAQEDGAEVADLFPQLVDALGRLGPGRQAAK